MIVDPITQSIQIVRSNALAMLDAQVQRRRDLRSRPGQHDAEDAGDVWAKGENRVLDRCRIDIHALDDWARGTPQ